MSETKTGHYAKLSILFILLAALAAVFLYHSFGGNLVSGRTGEAQDALRKEVDSQSQGNIELTDFAKTDGQDTEALGVKSYTIQFQGEITFKSEGVWLAHNPMAGPGLTFTFSKTPIAFGGMNGATQVHSGDRMKIAGTMEGQKSENGWNFGIDECHAVTQ